MADKPKYTKPASQVDLEYRNSDDYEDRSVLNLGDDAELSTNGYVGTDPIYQNHANDTEAPVQADATKSVEQKLLNENFLSDDVDFDKTATPEGTHQADEADEVEPTPSSPSGAGGGNVNPTPPPPPAPQGSNS